MSRTRIKICGVTRPRDALVASQCGADAIGIVLHAGSRRNVPVETARAIVASLPPFMTPVGVFVDASMQEVLDTSAMLELRTVQLNGRQSPDDGAELSGLAVIQAIRVTRGELARELERWRAARRAGALGHLIGLVMEPGGSDVPGGSGRVNDWDEIIAAKQSGGFDGLPALIAAGGLTPETVAAVVRRVDPWAVDVSSGVESAPGIKSPEKVRAFIEAVRGGDAARGHEGNNRSAEADPA